MQRCNVATHTPIFALRRKPIVILVLLSAEHLGTYTDIGK